MEGRDCQARGKPRPSRIRVASAFFAKSKFVRIFSTCLALRRTQRIERQEGEAEEARATGAERVAVPAKTYFAAKNRAVNCCSRENKYVSEGEAESQQDPRRLRLSRETQELSVAFPATTYFSAKNRYVSCRSREHIFWRDDRLRVGWLNGSRCHSVGDSRLTRLQHDQFILVIVKQFAMPLGTRGSRVEGPHARGTSLGGAPREQQMLKGHLPRVTYHQVY